MTLIRGTSLAGFPELVAELGGDAEALLSTVGISADAVGDRTAFIDYVGVLRALEAAARATGALDFGRRLAERQGVEIFGPVGIAASSASTFGEAVETYVRYLRAYSPAIQVGLASVGDEQGGCLRAAAALSSSRRGHSALSRRCLLQTAVLWPSLSRPSSSQALVGSDLFPPIRPTRPPLRSWPRCSFE